MKNNIVRLLVVIIVAISCFVVSMDVYSQGKITRPQAKHPTTGLINGHEYVDLGLPSGLKWAKCNIGANSPIENGNYYAWGETQTKSSYSDSNCKTHKMSSSALKSAGVINSNGTLTMSSDAAHQNWGSSWRMPTMDEFDELREKCTWRWTTKSGKNGYEVTGPNGLSIFLPAAGSKWESRYFYKGGDYWSSTLPPDDWFESAAYRLEIDLYNNDQIIMMGASGRSMGFTIRAVSK